MAQLRKLKGRFFAYFYDRGRKPDRKSVALKVSRKTAATAILHEMELARGRGDYDPWRDDWFSRGAARPLTMAEALERFFDERSHLRPASRKAYVRSVGAFGRRLPVGLLASLVTPEMVRAFVQDGTVKPATQLYRYRHLASFFRWAEAAGVVERSPVGGVRRPQAGREEAFYLTPAHVEAFVQFVERDVAAKTAKGHARQGEGLWMRDVVLFTVSTGLRLGEVCALRWSGVDLASGFLTVQNRHGFKTKSGSERRVPIAGDARRVLERLHAEWMQDRQETGVIGAPVFPNRSGQPLYPHYVTRRFKHYATKAGLPEDAHFHSLRHTCASWLVMRGAPLQIVQRVLGHSSSQVTERYAHFAPGVVQAAMRQAFGK